MNDKKSINLIKNNLLNLLICTSFAVNATEEKNESMVTGDPAIGARNLAAHHETAVGLLQAAAEQGSLDAQLKLAKCYANGEDVEQNDVEAERWYQAAADQGNVKTHVHFEKYCKKIVDLGANPTEVVRLYSILVKNRNHPGAQVKLGNCYFNGNDVVQDMEKAVRLYQAAAQQDVDLKAKLLAKIKLAECYAEGLGVEQDTTKARRLYEELLAKGYRAAELSLGLLPL